MKKVCLSTRDLGNFVFIFPNFNRKGTAFEQFMRTLDRELTHLAAQIREEEQACEVVATPYAPCFRSVFEAHDFPNVSRPFDDSHVERAYKVLETRYKGFPLVGLVNPESGDCVHICPLFDIVYFNDALSSVASSFYHYAENYPEYPSAVLVVYG